MIILILLAVVVFAVASWLSPILGVLVLAILIFCMIPHLVLLALGIILLGWAALVFVGMVHKGLDSFYTRKSSKAKHWEREYAQTECHWVRDPNNPDRNILVRK